MLLVLFPSMVLLTQPLLRQFNQTPLLSETIQPETTLQLSLMLVTPTSQFQVLDQKLRRNFDLANTGVSAGSYGSTTAIPVITVDAKGRLSSVSTASVGTALTVTGDSGSEDIDLLTESLAITGGTNITSTAASNGVSLALDSNITLTSVTADLTGDVTGNADTATTLETARTIGGVSFDGSANISLPGVDATGNQDTSGNAATATALATARTIGGVSFDGTADINLPGVNATGNQDTSGNASTASTLQTSRTIGGVSFNGSQNIDLPGVNTTGNQDTSGNAATATQLATARTIGGVSFDGSSNIRSSWCRCNW